jgi:hypothetical protein
MRKIIVGAQVSIDGVRPLGAAERWQSIQPKIVLKHNGQRWCALAVQDYQSRALPLSYGGACMATASKLVTPNTLRYCP